MPRSARPAPRLLAALAVSVLAAALAAAPVAPAAAQGVVDQQGPPPGSPFVPVLTGSWLAQGFRPTAATVAGFGLYFFQESRAASPTLTYELYDRRPDRAGALLLASVTSTRTLVGNGFLDAFFAPVAVTPGALYFVAARVAPAAGPAPYVEVSSVPGAYPAGGDALRGGPGAPTDPYTTGSGPALFREYAAGATAIPEPSTYALLAAGLSGVGVIARRRRRAPGA